MTIRFLSTIDEWKNFSNLAPYPIYLENTLWGSAEHYYQYKKYEKIDPEFALKIKETLSPLEVKKITLKNTKSHSDWRKNSLNILGNAVRAKFSQYPSLREQLISTGNELLIEANKKDYFWGEGENGSGKNMMGKILMSIREELR
jgi:ribA/ribD-fused uncharacterized protein